MRSKTLHSSLLATIGAVVVACGGGLEPTDAEADTTTRRTRPAQVAFYGDSLTVGRVLQIAGGAFLAADYAVWGQGSFAPLNPTDRAPVALIRYGMADSIRQMTPAETVANVTALAAHVRAQGRRPLIVGMPCLDSDLGAATAQALRAVQDVDVTPGCGPVPRTTDGIHPTAEEHARMDAIIRAAALAALNDAGL